MIKVLTGNIFTSKMQVKVNTVNCVGVMGKGIALLFKKQFPEMFDDYLDRCNAGEVEEGVPYLYEDIFGNKIINFPTKGHWKSLSKLDYIEKGLDIIVTNYRDWEVESIAFPPLGCGNGGLLWQTVGPIMYQKLSQIDVPVEIYAPFGTDAKYLKPEFLGSRSKLVPKAQIFDTEVRGSWIALLEVIHRLGQKRYTVPVGKIVFQKICYLASLTDMDLGITFKKGRYGPYSPEIDRIYNVFGRENLIKQTGDSSSPRFETGSEYRKLREKRVDLINSLEPEISRLVDLFSRVKSTKHAEEIGTIMFALSALTNHGEIEYVSETEFYEFIKNWKEPWDTAEKKESLKETIRYLASQGWIKLSENDTVTS
ncbi:MAG: macro domain-containing protein [Candidatus Cloacimonetes bacterium]|jgi:O-acetyl-ADP-ribose deacetylase (regulator of RNase III)/uncharacterized protein YwgA|nr:macro domain-containing protein [Candidatus Cloacimonadota bacterium]MCK9335450.1 macro domain-containing protein [Candidatus Cloacimonadota bacterium]